MHTSASTSNMRVDAAVRALRYSSSADYTAAVLHVVLEMALADMSKSKAIVRLEQLERYAFEVINQAKQKA